MTITSTRLDLSADTTAVGNLLITDASLLIPPAIPGQYPARIRHATSHAHRLLELGNDMGQYTWHLVTDKSAKEAHQLLDRVFYAYVDAACMELWRDARVIYQVRDETVMVKEYGFEEGRYTMVFVVHCNVIDVDALVAKLTDAATVDSPFIVVRPGDSPETFSADLFVNDEPDDKYEDYVPGDDDENDVVSSDTVYGRASAHFGNAELAREAATMYPGDFI